MKRIDDAIKIQEDYDRRARYLGKPRSKPTVEGTLIAISIVIVLALSAISIMATFLAP